MDYHEFLEPVMFIRLFLYIVGLSASLFFLFILLPSWQQKKHIEHERRINQLKINSLNHHKHE